MNIIAYTAIGIVALIHAYLFYVEIFAWQTTGRDFLSDREKLPDEVFSPSVKALPQNIGLYNGFLAAGLAWAMLIGDSMWQSNVAIFFLACVSVAGVVGWRTADTKLLFLQSAPALIGLVLLIWQR